MNKSNQLFEPLVLPCGVTLKNRIIKSAMSDTLGDGSGHPTTEQNTLYQRWADGGVAVSIIGEVQCSPDFAENPGNLVLNNASDIKSFENLAKQGQKNYAQLWLQLGHAGALAYESTSSPKGPSALDMPELHCSALSYEEIKELPSTFSNTAMLAKKAGFGGVQIHAAHGFLLSQFLSPLFNKRADEYGGTIENRMRLLLKTIDSVRAAVGPNFPIAIKLNSSDQLKDGFVEEDSLEVVKALDNSSIDLIDISGGTYFPGAKSASDKISHEGPYFVEFAKRARTITTKPLMLTGGFKSRLQAEDVITSGIVDVIGLARALILEPSLPNLWKKDQALATVFPKFSQNPKGGITAWYTMKILEISEHKKFPFSDDLLSAIQAYEERDLMHTKVWLQHFS